MMRRPALTPMVAALAVVAGGCGNRQSITTGGATEGVWLDVGAPDYHAQGARELNPAMVPDFAYLRGVPQGILPPGPDELWFAVFLRVENRTDRTWLSAHKFEIVDTQGKRFAPLDLDPRANPFAYRSRPLLPNGV